MRKSEAVALVAVMQAAWPARDLGPETVGLYVEHLEPIEYDRALSAVRWLVASSRFLPSIAELLDALPDPPEVPALPTPARPKWSEEDEQAARETISKLAKDWREHHVCKSVSEEQGVGDR